MLEEVTIRGKIGGRGGLIRILGFFDDLERKGYCSCRTYKLTLLANLALSICAQFHDISCHHKPAMRTHGHAKTAAIALTSVEASRIDRLPTHINEHDSASIDYEYVTLVSRLLGCQFQ